jgi:oligopeptide transport system substrate-binding protein
VSIVKRRRFLQTAGAAFALGSALPAHAATAVAILRRARGGNLTTLDPHRPVSAPDMEIAADLFCGLTAVNAAGNLVPGCAESWRSSSDGLRHSFQLRSGLKWSDGRPLTANDFVASFRRLLSPATAALLAYRYAAIDQAAELLAGRVRPEALGVSATNDNTVVFSLQRPEADLLQLLAVAYVVPSHAIARWGVDWAKPPQIVVNGAFLPRSWQQNGTLQMSRNPLFFDVGRVKLDELQWLMGVDDATRLRLFRTGELDVAQIAESSQLAAARRELASQLHSEPFYGGGWVGLQTARPGLRDVRARRALALGVDRSVLADKVRALGERPSESLVPDAVSDYPRHAVPEHAAWPMAQRRGVAAQLLNAVGYSAARPLPLTAIFSANGLTQRSFLALAAMWRPLGVSLSAQGMESRAYNLALRSGDFDLMDYAPFSAVQSATSFIGRFHSRSFLNFSHYSNPEVDRLIDLAERQLTPALRSQQYLAVEQQLLRDWPAIPLYSGVTHRLVAARVHGWTTNPGLSLPSRYLIVQEPS